MKKKNILLHFWEKITIFTKKIIYSDDLKNKFRKSKKDFTRNRILTYNKMLILLLQKWVKSLQLRLNEFWTKLDDIIATDVAFIKARAKILPEVFLQMNVEIILHNFYNLKENIVWYETFWNFRLLAIDGSKIRLPDEKEISEKYGKVKFINRNNQEWSYTSWLLSVLHDPLNNLAIDSILEKGNYSERALAIQNIQNLTKLNWIENNDLILFDRGYFSSFLASVFDWYEKEYVFRLRKWAIKEIDELFNKDCKINEKIITLKVDNKEKEYKEKFWITIDKELKKEIRLRIIRVILDDWEVELLVTSLLDTAIYPHSDFKELYYKRWWIEIYYDVLKNRLWLENFSWKTIHSVLQDLNSTIFLSNYETIITRANNYDLEEKCRNKKTKNKQKVNKQVSFNTIKNTLIELFLEDIPIEKSMKKIVKLFEMNPTQIRPWRTFKRWTTTHKSLNFHKRKKKHCF